jgi:hypothetical protein
LELQMTLPGEPPEPGVGPRVSDIP